MFAGQAICECPRAGLKLDEVLPVVDEEIERSQEIFSEDAEAHEAEIGVMVDDGLEPATGCR